MSLMNYALYTKIITSLGLALVFVYLFYHYRERYMKIWTVSWCLYGIRLFLDLLRFEGYSSIPFLLANQVSSILSVTFLLWGTYEFVGKKFSRIWLGFALIATLLSDIAIILKLPFAICTIPTATYFGVVNIITGLAFRSCEIKGIGKNVTGYSLILLGVLNLSYPFFAENAEGAVIRYLFLAGSLLEFTIIIGSLLVYFQKTRKELVEKEKAFRLLAENAKDVIYKYEIKPLKSLLFISPSVYQLTGYTPEEFYKKNELINVLLAPSTQNLVLEKSVNRETELEIFQLIRKDEKVLWVETNTSISFDQKTKSITIEGIVRDISKRKELEEKLIHLNQLKVLAETAATIAHEVRNPMTTVKGLLQILSRKDEYKDSNDYFTLMLEEIDRANEIIENYLILGQKNKPLFKNDNLNEILKNVYPLLVSMETPEKKVVLELGECPDLKLSRKEIKQLIFNLAKNGLEVMGDKGQLTIQTYVQNEKTVVAIRDEGGGIDPSITNNIGSPFFTTKQGGTGLGLALCFEIAALHSAGLTYETGSTGTIFYVKFDIPD